MDVLFNEGISKIWEILDIWAEKEIIKKSGAFYSYWEVKLWQWKENSKTFLRENPKIATEIEKKIIWSK
jgi:recombination protein RecA